MTKRVSASQRRKQREDREKKRKQQQRQLILISIAVIVIVMVGLIVLTSQPLSDVFIPEDVDTRYERIDRGYTDEGFPRLGSSEAPVSVVEFASFSCPGCFQFHQQVFPDLIENIRRGEIEFVYIPLQTGTIPNQEGAAKTALCAGEQDKFWEMHDILFDWQGRYSSNAFQNNRLLAGVEALGLNQSDFTECFRSPEVSGVLNRAASQGRGLATPTIQVNGVTVASATVDNIRQAIAEALPPGFVPNDIEPTTAVDDNIADNDNMPQTDENDNADISAADDDGDDNAAVSSDDNDTAPDETDEDTASNDNS